MRSKATIENQLAHLKADCTAAPEVNAHWIEVLEWVLGDDAHRSAYDQWITTIEHAISVKSGATDERFLCFIASELLRRLR